MALVVHNVFQCFRWAVEGGSSWVVFDAPDLGERCSTRKLPTRRRPRVASRLGVGLNRWSRLGRHLDAHVTLSHEHRQLTQDSRPGTIAANSYVAETETCQWVRTVEVR